MLKSNKEFSFGFLVDKGIPKQEIMRLKGISLEAEYQKIYNSLMESRKRVASSNRKKGNLCKKVR